jgi:signal transduction histidine kinase/DNA-binding response OmpR family regulator
LEAVSPNFRKIEILLVDDRPENLLALEAVLSSPDYKLVRAQSGDEALKYLLDHEPAVILMDVQMPDLSGFETAAIIKKSERLRDIPIIFITAINKDERFAHEGYAHGAVDYIFKPFDATILRSKVAVFADLWLKAQRLVLMEKQLRENERKDRERQIAHLELKNLKREQAEQRKYRELVEGIEHGIVWAADAFSLKVSFVSPSASKILGYPVDRWTAEEDFLLRRLHSADLRPFLEAVRKVHDTKRPESIEHRLLDSRGNNVWVHTGLRIARTPDDNGYEIRGLSTDVTQIKAAEDVLLRNKRRSDLLAEASLALAESLDRERILARLGEVLVPSVADAYSVVAVEDGKLRPLAASFSRGPIAKRVSQIAEDQGIDPYASAFACPVLSEGKPILLEEITDARLSGICPDERKVGQLRAIGISSVISMPLCVRGRTIGVLTLVRLDPLQRYDPSDLALVEDITERACTAIENADLYRQAQDAIRARDEFLSVASHELKTPLTPLKLHTQSLMRALTSAAPLKVDKVRKMLETSDRQIGRLTRLVDDLLDVSRISVGKLALNSEEFDAAELVHEIVERFEDQLTAIGSQVSFTAEPCAIPVKWDRFRIEQVVINLLTNAIKYGGGKPIDIRLECENDCVRLIVRDHGIGIAKEFQRKIFERFERAVPGTHYSGLGLGLYIVTQILKAHQGDITVTSEPGDGSTFTVSIPCRPTLGHEEESAKSMAIASTPPPVDLGQPAAAQ